MVYTLWLSRKADHCIWKEADRCFRKEAKFWKECLNLSVISVCTRWIEGNRGWAFTLSRHVQGACTVCYLGSRLYTCVREYCLYGVYGYPGPVRQFSIDPFCQCVLYAIVSQTSDLYSYSRTTASNLRPIEWFYFMRVRNAKIRSRRLCWKQGCGSGSGSWKRYFFCGSESEAIALKCNHFRFHSDQGFPTEGVFQS